jgi:hypothetical protein
VDFATFTVEEETRPRTMIVFLSRFWKLSSFPA